MPACTDAITVHVKSGEAVALCYTVTNTGSAPLNRHSLTTSVYSLRFAGLPYDLAPGESYAFSATYPVTYTMDNVAVWASEWASTAPTLTAGSATTPTITASGTATATVVIVEGGLYSSVDQQAVTPLTHTLQMAGANMRRPLFCVIPAGKLG